ncbi:hypothetical protein ACSSS7_004782 [Eimeria intestinalis]
MEGGVPLTAATLSHRLLGGVQRILEEAGKNQALAIEACAAAEVLGRSLQDVKHLVLRSPPETRSPLLLALTSSFKRASKSMPYYKQCTKIAAELSSVFGSATRVGDVVLPPISLAGGLANWLAMDRGPIVWSQQARKKLKTDAAAAALCAALRFAEFLRQITRPGPSFDRTLSLWHLSLPSDSLRLVNAMRTAAQKKDKLSQELCTLAPPNPQVQQLLPRFDPRQWAALAMQAEAPEETPTAAPGVEPGAAAKHARLQHQQHKKQQRQQQRTRQQHRQQQHTEKQQPKKNLGSNYGYNPPMQQAA